MSDESDFRAECPQCGVSKAADDLGVVSAFSAKHKEHTGHAMEWTQYEAEFSFDALTEWVVSCLECGDEWTFPHESEAETFREEHAEYTDHRIDQGPVERTLSPEELSNMRLRNLIEIVEEHYDRGAPVAQIYEVMVGGSSESHSRVENEIEKLKKQGEVYEPSNGYLRTT